MWRLALLLACLGALLHGAASSEVLDSVTLEQAQVHGCSGLPVVGCKLLLSKALADQSDPARTGRSSRHLRRLGARTRQTLSA